MKCYDPTIIMASLSTWQKTHLNKRVFSVGITSEWDILIKKSEE